MNPPIARQLNLDETKLPAEIFERLSRRGSGHRQPFGSRRFH